MEIAKNFGWIKFYTALADKLLEYRNNRPALIQKLQNAFTNANIPLQKLDTEDHFTDIDPFTFFAVIRKNRSDENCRKIIAALAEQFSIDAMQEDEGFDGIPSIAHQVAFYKFYPERGEHDIDNLWDLFAAAIDYSADSNNIDKKQTFITKYNQVKGQDRVKWNITIGLFWIRPYFYISLDATLKDYILSHENLAQSEIGSMYQFKTLPDGEQYLNFCSALLSDIQSNEYGYKSFPELSHTAFCEKPKSDEDDLNNSTDNTQNKGGKMSKLTHPELIKELVNLLKKKKQIVLTGAPGTGKTYLAKEIAATMLGKDVKTMLADVKAGKEPRYQFRQFHPGYDYSDFVEGLKPYIANVENGTPTFVPTPGVFMKFCLAAAETQDSYVMVIDEINRADLSRVFGELFYGLENDYRGEPIPTQYSYLDNRPYLENGESFKIPPNVYIIGTMNDIDRSVESMDFALRRRFAWQEITVEDSENIITNNVPGAISGQVITVMRKINEKIIDEKLHLEKAYYLGGAYFKEMKDVTQEAWEGLWKNHIKVILTEYLRASRQKLNIENLKKAFNELLPKDENEK